MAMQKYVRHSQVGFILWPATHKMFHNHVGKMLEMNPECKTGTVISAGFAHISKEGRVECWGQSDSLGISSRSEDSELLAKQLGFTGGVKPVPPTL